MLSIYAQAGVKELCLRAQNEYGIDVLLLLMDAWLKKEKRPWPKQSDLQAYLTWREQMIVPLRALRMSIEKDDEPLRSQLLTAELSAEKNGVVLLSAAAAQRVATTECTEYFLEKSFVFFNDALNNVNQASKATATNEAQRFYELFYKHLEI